jgi:PAS domain S-box-containing protein
MTVSDAALHAVMDLFEVPATLLDLDGRIRYVNPANARLLGRTAEELRGEPVSTILPAEMRKQTSVLLASLLEHGKLDGIFWNVRPDGSTVPVEVSATLVRSADGTPRRILATVRDLGAQLAQLTRLNTSALGLLTTPGDGLLVTIVRVARELLGARYAALGVVEDDRLVRFIPDGMGDSQIAGIEHWPEGRGLLGAMITERRTVRLDEIGADPRSSGFPPGHPPMRSFLGTPIRAGDEVYGHLYFTDKLEAAEFSFVDEHLAELFASHAAIEIRDQRRRETLEGSARLLAEAQEIGGIGSGEWDLNTDRMRWSDEALRLFGMDAERIAHIADFLAIVAPDDRSSVETGLRSTLDSGRPFQLIHRLVRGDGELRVFSSHAELMRDASGTPVRIVGTVQDITERVAAEEERARLDEGLQASERNLAEAQRIAHIGSWEWNLATDTAQRSEETHRIFGVALGAIPVTNEAFLAFVHPDDRARVQASERAAIRGGGRHGLDYRIVRPDGTVRIVHEEGELIRDPSGTPVRMVGTVQDVTDRVAAEEERTRLVSAVEQTADSIMVTDQDGTIAFTNPSFARLYGYRPEEVAGQHARILRSDRHDAPFYAARLASLEAGEVWTGSIVNRRKDGTLIEVESVISGIRDAEGLITGYVQADRDVTRERELEGAIEREIRERESVEHSLARIDASSSVDEIAVAACAEIVCLPDLESVWIVVFVPGGAYVLAAEGLITAALSPGQSLPESRALYLRQRATAGPWVEPWLVRPEWTAGPADARDAEAIRRTGLLAVAYTPLVGAGVPRGVILAGAHQPGGADRMVERLPALATFGSVIGALIAPGLEARDRDATERASVQAILDAGTFTPFFQPIVELQTGAVVGHEALTRFADGTRPDVVFASAARVGLGVELEVATLDAALGAAAVLPPEAYLSLNASPALISSDRLGPLLAGLKRRITLEVTEHAVVEDYAGLRRELAALAPNVSLAVDDAGAGYASFHHILELAPDVVKLDLGLVRGIDADPARQALIAGMGYFAVKRKIRLIAEGIETTAELETLRSLAIQFGQGYLLGRPQDSRGPGPWPMKIALGIGEEVR